MTRSPSVMSPAVLAALPPLSQSIDPLRRYPDGRSPQRCVEAGRPLPTLTQWFPLLTAPRTLTTDGCRPSLKNNNRRRPRLRLVRRGHPSSLRGREAAGESHGYPVVCFAP